MLNDVCNNVNWWLKEIGAVPSYADERSRSRTVVGSNNCTWFAVRYSDSAVRHLSFVVMSLAFSATRTAQTGPD